MKIINIVENLDKGAVENWLVNVFIESRKFRPNWEWTFYCILGLPGNLDQKVKNNGGVIIYSPCTVTKKRRFIQSLHKVLIAGEYDIIHSHHDYLSGFYLLATFGISFKKRILHIHNTDAILPIGNKFLNNLFLEPLRRLSIYFSDIIVGISCHTLHKYISKYNLGNKKSLILYYGIKLDKYQSEDNLNLFREKLQLPKNVKLILFCGRINYLKNPIFIVDILSELLKLDKTYHAVFVGEGNLTNELLDRALKLEVLNNVHLMGWRDDIELIMKSCDVFVFPRIETPKEGLGLVVVEAQAAALPMVLSNGILNDAIVIPELAHFIPLDNNPEIWAEVIINTKKNISFSDAIKIMNNSKFSMSIATQNLIKLYES
jgi:glycosyltransferase involved in cell wall biosynthesis